MPQLCVGSREYKIMLKPARFAGDEAAILKAAAQFWREGVQAFGPAIVSASGSLDQAKERRLIRFCDTASQHLNRNAYIFRERRGLDGAGRETTLKFRHPDRYVSADRDLAAEKGAKAKTKFEEDIKPPFQPLYSYSVSQEIAADRPIALMKDLMKLHPGLKDSLAPCAEDEPLAVVDGFTARELVIGGAAVRLGKSHEVSASCVLVVWHDHDEKDGNAVVAEFSYRYGAEGDAYGGGSARRAYDMFQRLQTDLSAWTDKDSKTKTAFVYS